MPNLKLHLDADTSIKALHTALTERDHSVTRTPNAWMPEDASDEAQLLGATEQHRCIFTFNIKDFTALAAKVSQHNGILLAAQRSWSLSELIRTLDHVLSETQSEYWQNRVLWLNHWRNNA
ncbi:MAG: DUF5615 family PIN-like protein [Leptolyngbyaceae cyanobacterium]